MLTGGRPLCESNPVRVNTFHFSNLLAHDKFGRTPLHYAAMTGNVKGIRLLLTTFSIWLSVNTHFDLDPAYFCDKVDCYGDSALIFAVRSENIEVVRLLLEYSTNPFARNHLGQNLLDLATGLFKMRLIDVLREN